MATYHEPVCVKCHISMYPYKNGCYVIDTFMNPPRPYKIWACDQWACKICDNKVMTGFSSKGIRHEEIDFPKMLELALKSTYVYNFETKEQAGKYYSGELGFSS